FRAALLQPDGALGLAAEPRPPQEPRGAASGYGPRSDDRICDLPASLRLGDDANHACLGPQRANAWRCHRCAAARIGSAARAHAYTLRTRGADREGRVIPGPGSARRAGLPCGKALAGIHLRLPERQPFPNRPGRPRQPLFVSRRTETGLWRSDLLHAVCARQDHVKPLTWIKNAERDGATLMASHARE